MKSSKSFRYHLISLTILMTLAAQPALTGAEKTYGDLQVREVTSIYDGDTFRANLTGLHPIIGARIPVRINGIDTPEMDDPRPAVKEKARLAKQWTVQKLRAAKTIELRNVQRGKYFRIVADVYVDGQNLGESLIKAGLAQPYDGGRKPDWE